MRLVMFISGTEKQTLFNAYRDTQASLSTAVNMFTQHMAVCDVENTARRDAENRALADRQSFRREMRMFAVMLIVGLIGLAGAVHWGIHP